MIGLSSKLNNNTVLPPSSYNDAERTYKAPFEHLYSLLPSSQEIFKDSLKNSQNTNTREKKVLTMEVSQTQKLNGSDFNS